LYAVDHLGSIVCKAAQDTSFIFEYMCTHPETKLLFEIASPVMYAREPSAQHNWARWSLYNMAQAAKLNGQFPNRVVVAPSSAWTHGHELKIRHELAKCTQKQKDLRECEAMMFFYRNAPSRWVSLNAYLENL
jgi:hypothetical protein